MNWFQYLYLPLATLGINAILAVSLQLILGGAGIFSLGHATFFAIGAYTYGLYGMLTEHLEIWSSLHIIIGTLLSLGVTFILSGFIALPCLRLNGDYLAMATLGFGQIVSTLLKNMDFLGGASGFKIAYNHILMTPWSLFTLIWVSFFVILFLMIRLYQTGVGYSILAIRDSVIAARCLGIRTQEISLGTFMLGSTLAGLAGIFYAQLMQFISPNDATFLKSIEIVLAVVIGGVYHVQGALIGVFFLLAPLEALRFVESNFIKSNRMLIYGVLVILFILILPDGLYDFYRRRIRGLLMKFLKNQLPSA